ncbi:hypothetical protein P280DRAFT_449492 [Massarina eburnea CBS 473.64]|uniref:RBR-type E3 ubiquitin transferase n=1 Tax=Massarina eburnea CBS 473.64 TaxID=1395130 RepID=A0A6A6S4I7_9PLEO|nr:hypothetical protein P280DRAFT_449492 [Massarina eburnea CBS 473.64]
MARTMQTTRKPPRAATSAKPIPVKAPKASIPRSDRILRSAATPASVTAAQTPARKARRRRKADPWAPKRKPRKVVAVKPPTTHYTCRICIEEKPVDAFVPWVPLSNFKMDPVEIPLGCMSHLARSPRQKIMKDPVCKACIGQSIAARYTLAGARQVNNGCLEPGCQEYWDWDFIMTYFPPGEAWTGYTNDLSRDWVVKNTVTCPNPQCGAQGQPDYSASGFPQVQCLSPTCKLRFCVNCNVPWHTEITCADVQARNIHASMLDLDRKVLAKLQKAGARRCPNCNIIIEKDGGCSSMFCVGCREAFDWDSAPSLIPGTRKAMPSYSPRVLGLPDFGVRDKHGQLVCEMDALEENYEK